MRRGIAYRVGDGNKANFWRNVWLEQVPLSIKFPSIFAHCADPDVTVAEVLRNDGIHLTFRRSFGRIELEEWNEVRDRLSEVIISERPDVGFWPITKNDEYTAKSMYNMILDPGVVDTQIMELWKASIPLKIKFLFGCVTQDASRSRRTSNLKAGLGSWVAVYVGRLKQFCI